MLEIVMDNDNPGVTSTPPVEQQPSEGDAKQPSTAPESQQPASEGVKPPEGKQEQHVPYDRFQEVNNKAKEAAARAEEAERRIADLEAKQKPQENEPTIDPEAEKVLDAWRRKNGFVTKEELETEKLRLQAESDIRELKSEHEDFDRDKVLEYADENGLQISNKAGLKAAYKLMKANDPSAEEAIRNKILAELKESGQLISADAEKPGAGGAKMTPQAPPQGLKDRIHAAVAKHRS